MQHFSCGLGPFVPTSGTGIPRCSSNQGTASPADGFIDIYLLLRTSDSSGCEHQLQM